MKHGLLMLIGCLCILPARGEAGWGRLFLTPAERAEIDRWRAQRPPAETRTGEVIRSDGRNTYWVDHEARWQSSARAPDWAPLTGSSRLSSSGQR